MLGQATIVGIASAYRPAPLRNDCVSNSPKLPLIAGTPHAGLLVTPHNQQSAGASGAHRLARLSPVSVLFKTINEASLAQPGWLRHPHASQMCYRNENGR